MRKIGILSGALIIVLTMAVGASFFPCEAVAVWDTTTRVSLASPFLGNSGGAQGDDPSRSGSISANGRYVAFESEAANLASNDTNGVRDVFVRDRDTGATTRVSLTYGAQGNGASSSPAISADGRYVGFASGATNLVAGDTNAVQDIFVRDRVGMTTTRVSVDSAGTQANGGSISPAISADGRYVAFVSGATNLVAGDTNATYEVFVHDRVTGATTRVSASSSGVGGNSFAGDPSVSADGRYVAFYSSSTNLVPGDTNGVEDVFLRDRTLNTTLRVSVGGPGVQGNGISNDVSVSGDGRYVAFGSGASNLVVGDTNGSGDVFVYDCTTGIVFRVSGGVQGNGSSFSPSISFDGRRISYVSSATNLVPGDTNGVDDIFVRDRVMVTTTRVSVNSAGSQGSGSSDAPRISSDGRYVAFESDAADLVAGDTNGVRDVFIHEAPEMTTAITIKTAASTATTGKTVRLSGAVTPFGMIGKNIVVYVKKPGKTFFSYSSNRTAYNLGGAAAWLYPYYFKPGMVKGYYIYKAVVPEWPGFLTSTSPNTVTIRLK